MNTNAKNNPTKPLRLSVPQSSTVQSKHSNNETCLEQLIYTNCGSCSGSSCVTPQSVWSWIKKHASLGVRQPGEPKTQSGARRNRLIGGRASYTNRPATRPDCKSHIPLRVVCSQTDCLRWICRLGVKPSVFSLESKELKQKINLLVYWRTLQHLISRPIWTIFHTKTQNQFEGYLAKPNNYRPMSITTHFWKLCLLLVLSVGVWRSRTTLIFIPIKWKLWR